VQHERHHSPAIISLVKLRKLEFYIFFWVSTVKRYSNKWEW
jgi:hypothetical protein